MHQFKINIDKMTTVTVDKIMLVQSYYILKIMLDASLTNLTLT